MTITTHADAKSRARHLRNLAVQKGETLSHGHALEQVAREQGARNWNTLSAQLAKGLNTPEGFDTSKLRPGLIVEGRYMGQSFTGRVVNAVPGTDTMRVSVHLDEPVDTVTFASFSNLRRRVQGTIGKDGCTSERNSQGVPHLILTGTRPEN